jgi:hypothetical protein
MKPSIYDLSYDFARRDGHFLVFTDKDNVPLTHDDLVPLQKKMIQSNEIPRLLPIRFEEIDFRVRLHCEITSKKMFSHYMKEKKLLMDDYYTVFLAILEALEESKLYMLNSENYLLHEDFIFVGKETNQIHLTYLPLKTIPGKKAMQEELKDLLVHVAAGITDLKGGAFKTLLKYNKDSGFSLSGLKELLLQLQSEKNPSDQQEALEKLQNPPTCKKLSIPEPEPFEPSPQETFIDKIRPKTEAVVIEETEESLALTSREKIYLLGLIVIGLALIWKFYQV